MTPTLVEVEGSGSTAPVDRRAIVTAAFEAHHAELYGFLRRMTRDDAAAEDLLQEAFLRLTTEVRAGRPPLQTRSWLYRVASNLAVDRSRRNATLRDWLGRHGRQAATQVAESPESGTIVREWASAVDAVLASLPADARAALLLSAEGFSGEEIAKALGKSHGATRTLLSRTRVRVRLELDRRGTAR